MERTALFNVPALALAIAGILLGGSALAEKPSWAGAGKGAKQEQRDESPKQTQAQQAQGHFDDRQRAAAHQYYSAQFQRGNCPPGLAKKHNGCMPPGQAKKWAVGRPLPQDVIYYDVPRSLVAQFGQPPSGHRYVRVASDILLIALGTGMVLDALQDLGRI